MALGGSLHQRLQDLPDRIDHSTPMQASRQCGRARRTAIRVTPGGWLHRLAGTTEIAVNSLHNQGVDRLAPGPGGRGHRARTARSRRCGSRNAAGRSASRSACSGIRNTTGRPIRCPAASSKRSPRRCAPISAYRRPRRFPSRRSSADGQCANSAAGQRAGGVAGGQAERVIQPGARRPGLHQVGAPGNDPPSEQQQHDEARRPGDTQAGAGTRRGGAWLARRSIAVSGAARRPGVLPAAGREVRRRPRVRRQEGEVRSAPIARRSARNARIGREPARRPAPRRRRNRWDRRCACGQNATACPRAPEAQTSRADQHPARRDLLGGRGRDARPTRMRAIGPPRSRKVPRADPIGLTRRFALRRTASRLWSTAWPEPAQYAGEAGRDWYSTSTGRKRTSSTQSNRPVTGRQRGSSNARAAAGSAKPPDRVTCGIQAPRR